jgi:hypothetical protein
MVGSNTFPQVQAHWLVPVMANSPPHEGHSYWLSRTRKKKSLTRSLKWAIRTWAPLRPISNGLLEYKTSCGTNESSFIIWLIDKPRSYLKVSGPKALAKRKIFKEDHSQTSQGDERWEKYSNARTAKAHKQPGKDTGRWPKAGLDLEDAKNAEENIPSGGGLKND